MTERSWGWTTGGGGDDDALDRDVYDDIFTALAGSRSGVIIGLDDALEVSNPSGQTIRIASGWALVDGKPYQNDSDLDLAATIPSVGTTGFRVVLRKSWSAQTVRAAVVMNTDGNSAPPPLTQNDGTTWELSLATGTITTGGSTSVDDARPLIGPKRNARVVAMAWIRGDTTPDIFGFGVASVVRTTSQQYEVTLEEPASAVFVSAVSSVFGTSLDSHRVQETLTGARTSFTVELPSNDVSFCIQAWDWD